MALEARPRFEAWRWVRDLVFITCGEPFPSETG